VPQAESLSPDSNKDKKKPVQQLDFRSRMMATENLKQTRETMRESSVVAEGQGWNFEKMRDFGRTSSF
jgi:hypothetical protein